MNAEIESSIWNTIASTAQEATSLKIRSAVLCEIRKEVGTWQLSQKEAARRLGLIRQRLNDLLREKLNKFSLDELVNIAASAQLKIEITILNTSRTSHSSE